MERIKFELDFPIAGRGKPVSCHEPLPCKSCEFSSHLLVELDTFIFNLTPIVELFSFFSFFYIMNLLLKYKKLHGALAMA